MTDTPLRPQYRLAAWHLNLLTAGAVFTVLLIAMGGVLCVTQSIRSCPDWPGCFGKILPPLEVSPILEVSHRLLAGCSGLLILAAAIAGLTRGGRLRWIYIPPLVACALVVEVSYFGRLAVLGSLARGWAAVDVGSALLVVALMVTTAVIAHARSSHPDLPDRLDFGDPLARLVLAATVVVYAVLVSGILVAGNASISACLGWPVYSLRLVQGDLPGMGNVIRLAGSALAIVLLIVVGVQSWRNQRQHPGVFRLACWTGVAFVLEALLQVLLLIFGFTVALLVPYTITAAAFWGLLVALTVASGLSTILNSLSHPGSKVSENS